MNLLKKDLSIKKIKKIIESETLWDDQNGIYPKESIKLLAEKGLFGILVPEQYNGMGMSIVDFSLVTETIAQNCPSLAVIYMFHNQVVKRILDFGTEQQKREYLPLLASGEKIAASSWSELKAGADKKNIRTSAKVINEGILLNGRKAFCTGAGEADIYTILANTSFTKEPNLTFVIISLCDKGLTFGDNWNGMGLRGSSTREIILDNCLVPRNRILGEIGLGRKIMEQNRYTAIHPGIIGLGIAKKALSIIKSEISINKKIWVYQNTRMIVADLITKVNALESLTFKAAKLADKNDSRSADFTMQSKIYAADICSETTDKIMHLLGAKGYLMGNRIETLCRDSKAIGIMGPTTELCKEYLAQQWK